MNSLTTLLGGGGGFGDRHRYAADAHRQRHGTTTGAGPVVVWNWTRTCNLRCVHCYYDAAPGRYPDELTTPEARALIDDCAAMPVPALLVSGGEPLMRRDAFDLLTYARTRGVRCTLSSNGTLIDRRAAERIREAGVSYVGLSLDGIGPDHDRFRGQPGAYDRTLAAIRHLRAVGQRVGLRFTLSRHTVPSLPAILRLVEDEGIQRICFYHLVFSGRGRNLQGDGLPPGQTRSVMDLLLETAARWLREGRDIELLTVDNHADAVYALLWARRHLPERATAVADLVARNGGNRSGIALACVDSEGGVHPDQFSQHLTVGNVRERPFSAIWRDDSNPVLGAFRDRRPLLPARCRDCAWLAACNGNFRARAFGATGDLWGEDPACYLWEEEIHAAAGA